MPKDSRENRTSLSEAAARVPSSPVKTGSSTEATYHGHRERLRQRFNTGGVSALADYELLELLLFRSIRRADTKPVAKALLKRFGSLAEVLAAPEHLLLEVKGVGPTVAFDLKLTATAARQMLKGGLNNREVLGSWNRVIDYCSAADRKSVV